MSENKRANLITVDSTKKSKHKISKTIRISLDLFEPNKKKFPEFNYKELVKDEESTRKEEKDNKGAQNGIKYPLSDNDEDVERIAKQFEQKYGSSSVYGRRKGSCKQEDYADIGAGYDENDSFIDNTDGYDEMVPPECDTVLGGFYINSGSLEFKNVVGIGVDLDDASPTHRKTCKRPLSSSESEEESSSSEDESETSTGEKRHSEEREDTNNHKVTDSEKSGEDTKKKSKVKEHPEREEKETLAKKKRKSSQDSVPGQPTEPSQPPSNKKTVRELLAETRAISGIPENNVDASTDSHSSDSPAAVPSSDNPVTSDSSREVPAAPPTSSTPLPTSQTPPVPPLPPNLPPEAVVLAKRLKDLAETHFASHTGKLSGPEVNEIILGMEKHCRKGGVAPSVRHALFSHAAALLRRGKPGLIQRARRLADESDKITSSKSTIDKLKGIIDKMKPALLQNYKMESERIVETNKTIALQNSTAEDDKKIPEKRLPKRRFPWNDQVRSLIADLLKEQNIPEEDEQMARFLHNVVLPLFPCGFVRMPTLLQQAKLSKNIKSNDKSKNFNKSFDKQHNLLKQPTNNKTMSPDVKANPQNDVEMLLATQQRNNKLSLEEQNNYVSDTERQYAPKLGDNISISLTNVFQGEKLSPSPPKTDKYHTGSSLTITPVLNKETRPLSTDAANSFSIIPKSLSISPTTPTTTAGTIKVKSGNALFDKNTIAKIISGKNTTHVENNSKQESNRDNYKCKPHMEHHKSDKSTTIHMHPSIEVIPKANNLPDSPLPMLSKAYLGTSEPRMEDLKSPYINNSEMFVKPKYKTDNSPHYHRTSHPYSGNYHKSPEGKLPESNRYQRESSKSPNDKSYEPIHLSPAHNASALNSMSVLKQHRSQKKSEGNSPVPSASPNTSKPYPQSFSASATCKKTDAEDSSSDDCVEIVGEGGYTHKRSKASVYRELEKQYNTNTDFSIKSIVDDKYSVKNILKTDHDKATCMDVQTHGVIHNQGDKSVLKYPNIKRQAILESQAADSNKYKHSDSVSDSVKCEPVSVIKESRFSEHLNEVKPSDGTHETLVDTDKYNALDIEKVMQNLKELQELQCSPEEHHQRIYEDSTNKSYRTNHFAPDVKTHMNKKSQEDTSGPVLNNQSSFMETNSSHNITTGSH